MADEPQQKQQHTEHHVMTGITAPPASPVEPAPSAPVKSDHSAADKSQHSAQDNPTQVPSSSTSQPVQPAEKAESDVKHTQPQAQQPQSEAANKAVKDVKSENASEQPSSKSEHVRNTQPSQPLQSKHEPQSLNIKPHPITPSDSKDAHKQPSPSVSSPKTHPNTPDVRHDRSTPPDSERPRTASAENATQPSNTSPVPEKEQPPKQNTVRADAQHQHATSNSAHDPAKVGTQPMAVKENNSDQHSSSKPDANGLSEEKEAEEKPSQPTLSHENDVAEEPSKANGVKSEISNEALATAQSGESKHDAEAEHHVKPSALAAPNSSSAKPTDVNMEQTPGTKSVEKPDTEIMAHLKTATESADKKDAKKDEKALPAQPDSQVLSQHGGVKSKKEAILTEQNPSAMDIDTSAPGSGEAKTPVTTANEPRDVEMEHASEKATPITKSSAATSATPSREDAVMTEISPVKPEVEKKTKPPTLEENSASGKKSRKAVRKGSQSRPPRARSSSRGGAADSSFDSGGKQDSAAQSSSYLHRQKSVEGSPGVPNNTDEVVDDGGPRPVMQEKGLVMRVGNALFVTENQLDDLKTARLKDKKVLPFEKLTFKELRTYNRDQLRAYCFAYGMERRKKTEMEADMARYLSYWNRGKPGFAIQEYVPTSGRAFDKDDLLTTRGSHANQSSASLGGSAHGGADSNKRLGSRSQSGSGLYQDKQNASGAPGSANPQTSPSTPSAGNANRNSRAGGTPTSLQRGFGTSFKQRVHARQAGAKFKAAYNGAGDTIVNVVENAAAYFEGKASPEVIADQTKSFERYQFNVDLLTEIFDGPIEGDMDVPEGHVGYANGSMEGSQGRTGRSTESKPSISGKSNVMLDIAKRLLSNKRDAQKAELDTFEANLKRFEEDAKHTERLNMKLFQKLERAETMEQITTIKNEFEREFGSSMDCTSRPLVRRKIDKTLPPLVIPDEQSRILRFTFL